MKLDPVLLNMACSWSMKAYEDNVKDTLKIESRLTSTTVYIAKRKSIDVIAFRGTEQKIDVLTDINVIPLPMQAGCATVVLLWRTNLSGVKSSST